MAEPVPVNQIPRLPRRSYDGHKGTYGTVTVLAGSRGMSGAAVLCGTAALRAGAGLVRVASPASVQPEVAAGFPCYTTVPVREHTDGTFSEGAVDELAESARAGDVLALGPGLGRKPHVAGFVREVIGQLPGTPVVIDADGLNVLSPWAGEFAGRSAPLVLTPHPVEFARLTGQSLPMPADREKAAVAFAERFGLVLVLKGAGTVVTDGRRVYRNSTGNPGMATGGAGDVLTGVIAALIGQGVAAFDAAVLGVWVHGRAGDAAAARFGRTALTAADLLDSLSAAFREMENET
jgi:NAD(P)H-hydrate epimerase